MKKRLMRILGKISGRLLMIVLLLSVPTILFLPKLSTLVPTSSIFEQPNYLKIDDAGDFAEHSLFAPIRITMFLANEITDGNITYLRLTSAIFAALAALLLFIVLRQWHTNRIAVITVLMFLSSSWVLHAGRLANTEVLYLLAFPALMLVGTWMASKSHDNKLPLSMLLLGIILYVPGAWLFVAAGLILFRKHIVRIWRQVNLTMKLLSLGIFFGAITPLIYGFTKNRETLLGWLGSAHVDALSPKLMLTNFTDFFKELFISGPDEPIRWLVGTPVLDVFTIAMLALGIYAYKVGLNPAREKLLFSSIILCFLLIIFSSTEHLGLLIPIIYLVAANGIAYMLQAWFVVFPRNPVARSLGISIVITAAAVSSIYQMQRYYIAWPNAPSTRQVLNIRQ